MGAFSDKPYIEVRVEGEEQRLATAIEQFTHLRCTRQHASKHLQHTHTHTALLVKIQT